MKVFLPGGAGLVGLNLIALVQQHHPEWQLLVVDKKREAVEAGRKLFPAVEFLCEDLTSTEGVSWPERLDGSNACVSSRPKSATPIPRNSSATTSAPPKWCSSSSSARPSLGWCTSAARW